jgi:hypothetical protein
VVLERAGVEDHVVDCQDRPAAEVAQEVLRLAGWANDNTDGRPPEVVT